MVGRVHEPTEAEATQKALAPLASLRAVRSSSKLIIQRRQGDDGHTMPSWSMGSGPAYAGVLAQGLHGCALSTARGGDGAHGSG